jgi:hypothetical protein
MTRKNEPNPIAQAIYDTLISPNVPDSNLEPANVVDALAHIAKSGFAIAAALREIAEALRRVAPARAENGQDWSKPEWSK